jgi:hypothetical protein
MEQNEGTAARLSFVRRRYSEFKPVAGIPWPHVEEREINGDRAMTVTLKRVELNTGVSADLFKRPTPGPNPSPGWRRPGS